VDQNRRHPVRRFGAADGIILLVIGASWCAFAAKVTGGRRCVLYDTFRDLAWAENMRAGRIWADPALSGLPWWYAPGGPLIMAGLARLAHASVVDVYSSSIFWFNGLLPMAGYLLVRSIWDRTTAIIALLAVFVGSYWWTTHALCNIPGIQGTVLVLMGLWGWGYSLRAVAGGRGQSPGVASGVITGLLLAAATWLHPLCGIVLGAAIFTHVVLLALTAGVAKADGQLHLPAIPAARFMLLVALVAGLLTAPLAYHLMFKVRAQHSMMLRFFASELIEPEFYANALAPLAVPAGLLGAWYILRHQPTALWAVGMWLFCLLGQLAGYVGSRAGHYVPYMLPHEFQWHGQLAAGICGAVGVVELSRRIVGRVLHPQRSRLSGLVLVVAAAVAFGPGLRGVKGAGRYFIELDPLLERTSQLRGWICQNTSLEDVFVCPREAGYQLVAGLTGRKCIAVSPGHTNPLADLRQRLADLGTMLSTTDEQLFANLAQRYGASYLLLPCSGQQEADVLRQHYENWTHLRLAFAESQAGAVVYQIMERK